MQPQLGSDQSGASSFNLRMSINQSGLLYLQSSLSSCEVWYLDLTWRALQGIQWPQVITGVVTNILNALINFLFLFVLDLGVVAAIWVTRKNQPKRPGSTEAEKGSAVANCISQYCLVALLYVYIRWRDLHKATWAGWSTECLQEWGAYIRVAVPSMFMLCLEWWIYEIGYFLAGQSPSCSAHPWHR
ncbi:hypothetical protein JZ751_017068 [Albula glossodonta]|uniref:Uncharacterized protein n=1 Tax=Albula glossodonta TaxID=121402 RepID=A0A8T2NSJ5_9TELE|nr:hypothetical protein JZ751_017068 [Albula glossodonta]